MVLKASLRRATTRTRRRIPPSLGAMRRALIALKSAMPSVHRAQGEHQEGTVPRTAGWPGRGDSPVHKAASCILEQQGNDGTVSHRCLSVGRPAFPSQYPSREVATVVTVRSRRAQRLIGMHQSAPGRPHAYSILSGPPR